MKTDQDFMRLALEMAGTAKGKTNPNPMVGAVIVKDGEIVGTGIHRKAGEPHAEVHAFRMAGGHAKGATLYVTLEPCSHYGKTPPCAILVKESGVKRVVVAMEDPNPQVAGRGIGILREAGIEVEVGVLEEEAKRLNERFVHNMLTGRPFVISKTAMTLDGKIAAYNGHSKWVTGEEARKHVHELRKESDAILVGIGTVLADNPRLTTRLEAGGKNPVRVILDSALRIPLEALVTDCTEASTWIAAASDADPVKAKALQEKGLEIILLSKDKNGLDLRELLTRLYEKGITDIIVEGGSQINSAFLREGLIDKFLVYIAPKILGGLHSLSPFAGSDVEGMDEAVGIHIEKIEQYGEDLCLTAYPEK
jgi:diaminohydroxyphosphoribosylaminopyrimidine deaminase / 5-amino-6-(5-phosphoribosylamino)uracil reductase